jgi:hypothetical protein
MAPGTIAPVGRYSCACTGKGRFRFLDLDREYTIFSGK